MIGWADGNTPGTLVKHSPGGASLARSIQGLATAVQSQRTGCHHDLAQLRITQHHMGQDLADHHFALTTRKWQTVGSTKKKRLLEPLVGA